MNIFPKTLQKDSDPVLASEEVNASLFLFSKKSCSFIPW